MREEDKQHESEEVEEGKATGASRLAFLSLSVNSRLSLVEGSVRFLLENISPMTNAFCTQIFRADG